MLNEFKDIIDPERLPSRRKYLHYYIVGLVDGEGCFSITVKRQEDAKFGWAVDPVFHVTQGREHREILEILKAVFKCGRIIPKPGLEDMVLQYVVDARRHLAERIVPFFKKYKPIIRWREFEIFAEVVEALEKGEHKNLNGFKKLITRVCEASDEKKRRLNEVLADIERRMGASETIRRAP
jgi:hypothetical protein